jgi:hypothetical protein
MNKKRGDFTKILGGALVKNTPDLKQAKEVKDNQVGHENQKALEKLK